jgi:hypothetical protein
MIRRKKKAAKTMMITIKIMMIMMVKMKKKRKRGISSRITTVKRLDTFKVNKIFLIRAKLVVKIGRAHV